MKLLIAFAIAFFNYFFVAGQLKLIDPGFEMTEFSIEKNKQQWQTEGDYDLCIADSVKARSGKYSLHLKRSGVFAGTARAYQEYPFRNNGLKKYKIRAAIKTKNVKEGYAGVSVRIINSKGQLVCHQNLNMYAEKINGTKDWNVYEGDFYSNGSEEKIKIACFLWGFGDAWFDDIEISEIPFSQSPLPAEIEQYIREYFSLVQIKSIITDPEKISELEKNARLLCMGNTSIAYCHFILKGITFNLEDGHSFLSTPQEFREMYMGNKNIQRNEAAFAEGHMLDNHIAYIRVPTFASLDNELVKKAVDSLQNIIALIDRKQPKGWIVDLSNNNGGNSFAMFPGLGPLLGDGICGYSISADGSRNTLMYINGRAGWDNKLDTYTHNPYKVVNPDLPIAIIYSKETGSSAEVTALAFRGKPNCKSFGQKTFGATTRVDNFMLSDGASLNLAAGYDADRNGIVFKGERIPPDVNTQNMDESIREASRWILDFNN